MSVLVFCDDLPFPVYSEIISFFPNYYVFFRKKNVFSFKDKERYKSCPIYFALLVIKNSRTNIPLKITWKEVKSVSKKEV